MKKGVIIMVILLVAAIAGTYTVFVRYVAPKQQELIAHEKEAEALRVKIIDLEKIFSRTVPEKVIQAWQEGKQPWVNASRSRTGFFKIKGVPEIEIPDEAIPRFWYSDEYPKLEDGLFQTAAEKRITLGNIDFGINKPDYYDGKNPSEEEILEQINKYNYGIAMTEVIFDAEPTRVDDVVIWPVMPVHRGKSGEVFMRSIGYRFQIQYEDLLRFLQKLNASKSYITEIASK